jgi:hypothetical protein
VQLPVGSVSSPYKQSDYYTNYYMVGEFALRAAD